MEKISKKSPQKAFSGKEVYPSGPFEVRPARVGIRTKEEIQ